MTDRVVLAPLNHIHHHHHHNSLHHHHHYTPHAHHHHHHVHNSSGRKRKHVKRLSSTSQLLAANTNATAYYPSAFITNPCDQLFGPPQPFDYDLDTSKTSQTDRSFVNMSFTSDSLNTADTSINSTGTTVATAETSTATTVNEESNVVVDRENSNNEASGGDGDGDGGNENSERFEYIPTPKWTKIQNSILEELFKKSRYPKSNELKSLAQRFHVMDSDIEEWFRKRRGRDRKIKRKNEVLKNLIDSYIDK